MMLLGSLAVESMVVSIRNNGTLGFSQGALRRFSLESGSWFFTLHFDKESRVIGLKPTQDASTPDIVKLQRRSVSNNVGKTNVSAQIAARAFLDYYDIPYGGISTQSFSPVWDDTYAMILIDLKKPRNTRDDVEDEEATDTQV